MQSQTLSGFFSFIPFQIKRRIQPTTAPIYKNDIILLNKVLDTTCLD